MLNYMDPRRLEPSRDSRKYPYRVSRKILCTDRTEALSAANYLISTTTFRGDHSPTLTYDDAKHVYHITISPGVENDYFVFEVALSMIMAWREVEL